MSETFTVGPVVGERWAGSGPTVVLLHAGVADRRSWHPIAPSLAERYDVLAYDRRGYGQTPPPADGDPRPLQDLLAVLDAHADGAVWLVGNSMGGALALDAAAAAPERVHGVVGIGSAVSGDWPWQELASDEGTQRLEPLIGAATDLDEKLRLLTWLWLDGPMAQEGRVSGAARDLFHDMCRTMLVNAVPDEWDDNGVDGWAALPRLDLPATFLVGELDLAEQRDLTTRLAARLPGAREAVLPGTAHVPSLDAPEAVLAAVQEALAR